MSDIACSLEIGVFTDDTACSLGTGVFREDIACSLGTGVFTGNIACFFETGVFTGGELGRKFKLKVVEGDFSEDDGPSSCFNTFNLCMVFKHELMMLLGLGSWSSIKSLIEKIAPKSLSTLAHQYGSLVLAHPYCKSQLTVHQASSEVVVVWEVVLQCVVACVEHMGNLL